MMPDSTQSAVATQGVHAQVNADVGIYADSCLRVEHRRYFVSVKGKPLKLSRTEFKIISCLVSNIDNVVRLDALWSAAWDPNKAMSRKSIQVFISRVRSKLSPFGLRIDSVVDLGYILSHGTCCDSEKGDNPAKDASHSKSSD